MNQVEHLIKQINDAKFIWICGNGGSAATADHFATDLIKKGYRAISLSSNSSLMTMIGNDYGYDEVFKKQLEVLAGKRDLLVTISCSGTSPNVVKVIELAVKCGIEVFQFEVFDKDRDYQKLEDKHLAFAHKVVSEI